MNYYRVSSKWSCLQDLDQVVMHTPGLFLQIASKAQQNIRG